MKLTIGETVYDFEYSVSAMCELEREAGWVNVGDVLAMPEYNMMRYMAWAGLLKHHSLSLEQVSELVEQYCEAHGKRAMVNVITDAISAAGFMMAQGKAKAAK